MWKFPVGNAMATVVAVLGLCFQVCANVVSPQVQGNTFTATIEIDDGNGNEFSAELTLRFERVVGLSEDNLGISVQIANLDEDALWDRFSDGVGMCDNATRANVVFKDQFQQTTASGPTPEPGFPVQITIDPDPDSGFAFEGAFEIELYTRDLSYQADSQLRLFTAPTGADEYRDITEMITGGSYRTRASGGHFSEFMILCDGRSSLTVITDKITRLDGLLIAHAGQLPLGLHATLTGRLTSAQTAVGLGLYGAAMTDIEAFDAVLIAAEAAGQVPNVWGAAHSLDNVGGELRAAARTLRFSLSQAANGF